MKRLLIRPGGIGDCILTLPAMQWLSGAGAEVWAPTPVLPLVRFAKARSIASVGLDLLGLPGVEPPAGLVDETLGQFDEVVSWYGTRRPEFRSALSAAVPRAVFFPALPDPSGAVHAADFFAAQVGAPVPAFPRIECEPAGEAAIWIHPYSGSAKKNWPYERFLELARALERYGPVQWAETPQGRSFDDLYELGRRLAAARLYIGNDSGVTHLAAACRTPVVALFGASDARVWAPRGPNVRVIDEDGLERIGVGKVLEEARASLAR